MTFAILSIDGKNPVEKKTLATETKKTYREKNTCREKNIVITVMSENIGNTTLCNSRIKEESCYKCVTSTNANPNNVYLGTAEGVSKIRYCNKKNVVQKRVK